MSFNKFETLVFPYIFI